jgi:DNA-binding winged helix-turn-helix (wHTH) protein
VCFGEFELDLRTGELRRHGVSLDLPPQPAKILVLLVVRAGEVITRRELAEQVWGDDTFVNFDQGLNFAIRQIRAALGDDSETPRFIETLPKRGYRFIATISKKDASPVAKPFVSKPSISRHLHVTVLRSVVAFVAVVVVCLGLIFGGGHFRTRMLNGSAHRIESLAVLPLHNLSLDPEQ